MTDPRDAKLEDAAFNYVADEIYGKPTGPFAIPAHLNARYVLMGPHGPNAYLLSTIFIAGYRFAENQKGPNMIKGIQLGPHERITISPDGSTFKIEPPRSNGSAGDEGSSGCEMDLANQRSIDELKAKLAVAVEALSLIRELDVRFHMIEGSIDGSYAQIACEALAKIKGETNGI